MSDTQKRRSSDHSSEHGHSHANGDGFDDAHGPTQVPMVHKHRDIQGGTIRAAIFGISDGLVSNVALILGVAAASTEASGVVVAGVSGLLAGAASMAAGEYVSMKAQSELVEREIEIERRSIASDPVAEERELSAMYARRGIPTDQAASMAETIHADPDLALEVHTREELGIIPGDTGDPVGAAISSFLAFAVGATIPLVPWLITDGSVATITSVIAGIVSAAIVGITLARYTERSAVRTAARQVTWASGACLATFAIGSALGQVV